MKYMIMLAVLAASACEAQDLKLEVEVNSVGSVMVYLTNVSKEPVTVLTKGLSRVTRHGQKVIAELSPNKYMRRKTLIKQSLTEYYPVVLAPGQTTWIQYHGVRDKGYDKEATSFQLAYSIDEAWGRLHNVWHGDTEAAPIPLKDGQFAE